MCISTWAVNAQELIRNPDGSHSTFFYSPYGSLVIYPDGSQARIYDYDDSTSLVVYSDGSHSRIIYGGSYNMIINADYSFSVFEKNQGEQALPDVTGMETDFSEDSSRLPVSREDSVSLIEEIKKDAREKEYILLNDIQDSLKDQKTDSTFTGKEKGDEISRCIPYLRHKAGNIYVTAIADFYKIPMNRREELCAG